LLLGPSFPTHFAILEILVTEELELLLLTVAKTKPVVMLLPKLTLARKQRIPGLFLALKLTAILAAIKLQIDFQYIIGHLINT